MAITSSDPAVLQGYLAAAQAALHKVLIGSATTAVSYNGEEFRKTPADVARLRGYIRELQASLGVSRRPRGRRIVFG